MGFVCRWVCFTNFCVVKKMKKHRKAHAVSLLLLLSTVVGVVFFNIQYISPPTLVVYFNGKPAANAPLLLPVNGKGISKLDYKGSIRSSDPTVETAIYLETPAGEMVSIQFPKHGTKTVDIRAETIDIDVEQFFGLIKTDVEQIKLSDQKAGKLGNEQEDAANVKG